MKSKETFILSKSWSGPPAPYSTEGSLGGQLAFCDALARNCLGLKNGDESPNKIHVTISTKPLKIKGTRKLVINDPRRYNHERDIWNFARGENVHASSTLHGMFEPAAKAICNLFYANSIDPTGINPLWVHVKA